MRSRISMFVLEKSLQQLLRAHTCIKIEALCDMDTERLCIVWCNNIDKCCHLFVGARWTFNFNPLHFLQLTTQIIFHTKMEYFKECIGNTTCSWFIWSRVKWSKTVLYIYIISRLLLVRIMHMLKPFKMAINIYFIILQSICTQLVIHHLFMSHVT